MRLGIDIGGSHIGLGIVDENANIIAKIEEDIIKTQDMENKIEKVIVNNIQSLLEKQNLNISQIEKIGIAIPGVIRQNKIYNSNNLGLNNFNLVEKLKKNFDTNIQIRNDAKCAAICEKEYGTLKPYKDCIFLCMGTGIGGAVFLNNKLLKPEKSEGFEIGHMVIEKSGKKCSCGNRGCFESYCSMKNLRKQIIDKLNLQSNIKTSDINSLVKNIEVEKIIEEYIQNLTVGIGNIINLFEPEAICFGGSLVYIKDLILPKLEKEIKQLNLKFNTENIKYITAQYGNDAGIIGSILI